MSGVQEFRRDAGVEALAGRRDAGVAALAGALAGVEALAGRFSERCVGRTLP